MNKISDDLEKVFKFMKENSSRLKLFELTVLVIVKIDKVNEFIKLISAKDKIPDNANKQKIKRMMAKK